MQMELRSTQRLLPRLGLPLIVLEVYDPLLSSSLASKIAVVDATCHVPADLCFCNKSMTFCPSGSGSSRSCSLGDKSCQAPSELALDWQASTCTREQGSRSPCYLHAQHAMVSLKARLAQMHGTCSVLVALSRALLHVA